MTLIEELKYRGFLNQCTDEESLNKKLKSENITFYIGFDCTAKSLHIGSLIQIMIMRLFQKYGHTPVILIGSGTTRIGDPSGKDETRKILTDDEIKNNANNLKTVFDKYLPKTAFRLFALFLISSSVSIFLVSSFPEGSPMRVVPVPINIIGVCPYF